MNAIINEIQVTYIPNQQMLGIQKITNSQGCFNVLWPLFSQDTIHLREEFIILYLNRSNRVLGYFKAFVGGNSSVICDVKIILAVALKGMASSIILSHNHPSGNLSPSEQDLRLTKRVKSACKEIDIELLDHLVIGSNGGYTSLADEGLL
ncbi:JAB domain-containing protein [Algoriphagus algorifonticola]|uniref:JAB domain-containing protein n=1 Tax=Algoriphagus algorifonticola TaxID=2593007 RepID=UPI0011A603E8|nr:JAB domain-containing protein [Algoriphagus algorifonticola]